MLKSWVGVVFNSSNIDLIWAFVTACIKALCWSDGLMSGRNDLGVSLVVGAADRSSGKSPIGLKSVSGSHVPDFSHAHSEADINLSFSICDRSSGVLFHTVTASVVAMLAPIMPPARRGLLPIPCAISPVFLKAKEE